MIVALVLTLAAAAVSGVVHDSSGAVVVGASVIVRPVTGPERQSQTGPDGRFTIETPEGEVSVIVRAGGFAENVRRVSTTDGRDLDIEVVPAGLLETVTVTPTRTAQRLGDIPASVNVMTSETIESSPALLADDILRQVPTFSLFRRASGLVANPTAQGVSLRGVGGAGGAISPRFGCKCGARPDGAVSHAVKALHVGEFQIAVEGVGHAAFGHVVHTKPRVIPARPVRQGRRRIGIHKRVCAQVPQPAGV